MKKPDFSSLGKVTGKEGEKPATTPAATEAKPPEKTPEPKPPKPEDKKATEKPVAEPQKPARPAETPKPDKEAGRAPEKPVEAKKPEADKKTEAKKEGEEEKDLTDEEIDKLQPHPNTTSEGIKRFGEMKEMLKREANKAKSRAGELTKLRKEFEAIRDKALAPEIEQELTSLRALRQSVLKDADPEFQKEFNTKLSGATDNLFALLRANGLKEDAEQQMRERLDSYDENWWAENILPRVTNPLQRRRVEEAILARQKVFEDKQAKIAELSTNAGDFIKQHEEAEKQKLQKWGEVAQNRAAEIEKDKEWAKTKEVPEGATDEQKAAIEKHNAGVAEREAKLKDMVVSIYKHDPVKTTEAVYRALEADVLEEQLKSVQAAKDELQARVDELEALVGKARRAGDMTSRTGAPKGQITKPPVKPGHVDLGGTEDYVGPDFSTLRKKSVA